MTVESKLKQAQVLIGEALTELNPAPTPPPPTSKVIIGVNGGSVKLAAVLALGIKSERITFAPQSLLTEGSPSPAQSTANGFSRQAVVIANVDDGTPLSAVNVPALAAMAVAQAKLAPGAAVLECGNEYYLKGATGPGKHPDPARAAAIYVAVKKALLAAGITTPLGFPLYGDYARLDGSWSQVAAGNGWMADAAWAQPELAKLCDCLIHHTYGRVGENSANNVGSKALEVTHAQAVALGFKPDVYVTELGRKIGTVIDAETVKSAAEQAAAIGAMMIALKAIPDVKGIWPYAVKSDPWTLAQVSLEAIAAS